MPGSVGQTWYCNAGMHIVSVVKVLMLLLSLVMRLLRVASDAEACVMNLAQLMLCLLACLLACLPGMLV
jgi:hypothetical protein